MSTKTSIKRIALVAVSALGFGMVSGVSAHAANTITVGTAADATFVTTLPTARPNVAGVYTAGFKIGAGANTDNGSLVKIAASLTKPTGSSATLTLANNSSTNDIIDGETISGANSTVLTYTFDGTNTALTAAADTLLVDATINPDVVGAYTMTLWTDQNANGIIDSGEAYVSKSVSVVADAPVLTVSVVGGSSTVAEAAGNDVGALVEIAITNGGAASTIAGTEVISLSGITTFATGGNTSKTSITRTDFNAYGKAYIQAATATAGTYTLSAQGVGGGIAALLKTATITVVDGTGVANNEEITSFAYTNTTGVAANSNDNIVKYLKDTTITYKATGATTAGATTYEAGDVVKVAVVDTLGTITGTAGLGYTVALTLGTDATATLDVTFKSATYAALNAAPTAGTPRTLGSVSLVDTTANTKTVKSALALGKAFTISPNSTIRTKSAGSVTVTAILKDQFGIVLPNTAVTATLSSGSRNYGVATTYNLSSDSAGAVSFTYTDAPLAANAALVGDTWAIAAPNSQSATADGGAYAAGSVTVNWLASLGVEKVSVTTPNTTAGVANDAEVVTDIASGLSGAQAGAISVTAKVTDASGSVLVGVPVTWTVSGTGAAFTSTTVTSYTSSTGIATGKIYGWVAGKYTVTATAEGKTSTGSVTFGQLTAAEARSISVAAQGSIVTATVKDRFGNGVKDATVYASRTSGDGYFGTGVTKTSGTTDANGQVEFIVAGSSSTVTVSLVSPSASAGTQFGQSAGAKGYDVAGADATAFTATTVGTSIKDETGVGASFDAAGVSSASVEVTVSGSSDSVDAANEATDAANAATDAANAAAEAADAATAAAQDAQAAVAALATQVASLIAGIKAQITTLTNLVIKIQKKVRA